MSFWNREILGESRRDPETINHIEANKESYDDFVTAMLYDIVYHKDRAFTITWNHETNGIAMRWYPKIPPETDWSWSRWFKSIRFGGP